MERKKLITNLAIAAGSFILIILCSIPVTGETGAVTAEIDNWVKRANNTGSRWLVNLTIVGAGNVPNVLVILVYSAIRN